MAMHGREGPCCVSTRDGYRPLLAQTGFARDSRTTPTPCGPG